MEARAQEKKQEIRFEKSVNTEKRTVPLRKIQVDASNGKMGKIQELKKLRQPRSKIYTNMLKEVDALSDNDKKIIEAVQTLPVKNELIGILAECILPGCIIHAIDREGYILNHFTSVDELSDDFKEGYNVFFNNPNCSSVEIYTHSFCVVGRDGSVTLIDRK